MEKTPKAMTTAESSNDLFNEEAKELVAYFYSLFQPEVQKIYFNSKAIDQAISLIASLGYERAQFVVEFSAKVAPQTNYSPQTFGGILQYTSRAMAQVDEAERIRVKQHLITSCAFCSESGYRRIGTNTMRECTHDPEIEAGFPDANSIGTFQTTTSPDAPNWPSLPDTPQNENRPAESSASL